jgi:hypothetical protein
MTLQKKSNSYIAIHLWLWKTYAKNGVCEFCSETTKTEFALCKGKEYARNRENFLELCVPCHRRYDYTEDTRKRLIEMRSRITPESHIRRRKAVALEKNGMRVEFDSIKRAAKELCISRTAIQNVLSGRAPITNGYSVTYLQ